MEKIKAQSSDAFLGCSAHPKQLAMHKDSCTISKLKPKIRIIHIVAPEIIKTDVENFRDLVQRLTGNSSSKSKARAKKDSRRRALLPPKCPNLRSSNVQHQEIQFLQGTQRIMKEEDMDYLYKGESSISHGIFGGFGDIDINFVRDLTQFPLLPFKTSHESQISDMFGEIPLC